MEISNLRPAASKDVKHLHKFAEFALNDIKMSIRNFLSKDLNLNLNLNLKEVSKNIKKLNRFKSKKINMTKGRNHQGDNINIGAKTDKIVACNNLRTNHHQHCELPLIPPKKDFNIQNDNFKGISVVQIENEKVKEKDGENEREKENDIEKDRYKNQEKKSI